MNFYCVKYCKDQLGRWVETNRTPVSKNTELEVNSSHDLIMSDIAGWFTIISDGNFIRHDERKYVFYNGKKKLEQVAITFHSLIPQYEEKIESAKIEYIKKYRPEFERALDRVKVRIEQETVKDALKSLDDRTKINSR